MNKKKLTKELKVFIQVNIGNEEQKSGINKTELVTSSIHIVKKSNLDVIGLMCIPPMIKTALSILKKLIY